MKYSLINIREITGMNLFTPTPEQISNIKEGDFIKVSITFRKCSVHHIATEVLWVEVIFTDGENFYGNIRNEIKSFESCGLLNGDMISFSSAHIQSTENFCELV